MKKYNRFVGLVLVGALMGLCGCSHEQRRAETPATPPPGMGDGGRPTAWQCAEAASFRAGQAWDSTKQAASDAWNSDTAVAARKKAAETAHDAKEAVKSQVHEWSEPDKN